MKNQCFMLLTWAVAVVAYSGRDEIKVSGGPIIGSSIDSVLRRSDLSDVGSSGTVLRRGSSLLDDRSTTVIHRGGSSGLESSIGGKPIVRKVLSGNTDRTTVIKKVIGGRNGVGESRLVLGDISRIGDSPVVLTGSSGLDDSAVVLTGRRGLDDSPVVLNKRIGLGDSPVVFDDRTGLGSQVVLKSVGHGGSRRGSVDVIKTIDGAIRTADVLDAGVRSGISGRTIGVSGSGIIKGALVGSTGSSCRQACYRDADCFGSKVCVTVGCSRVCRRSESNGYSR